MAQIVGSTGSLPSHYAYWIDWVEDNVDTVNNTSRVTATVYVQKVGSYNVEGSNNSHTLYIDGTAFTANPYIDMNPETTPRAIVSGQKTITHNSDGTKSINISSSGQVTYISGAYYSPQSGSASAVVGLTSIPREASITNSVNYTIGDNVPLTFSNPGGMYMKVRAYVWDGTDWEPYIKDQNMGNGTSGTYTFDSGDLADIYTQLGNNLQASCKFRVYSYTGSDYSSGYVGYKDKDGIAYINQTTNKPTFTDFDVANYDKSIAVKDKYDNTLITSSTSTLLGSNNKVIKGYSKLRGTVAVADKMTAVNGATGIKYRFATPSQYAEGAYSEVADVNMDLDNVTTKDVSVTAYDSRGLTTTVNKSLSYLAEYVPVSLWGLTLVRDNGVDSETKLQISGSFWKQYFGGGTSGVQNTVAAHWRYKPTGDSWASQTWNSITLTDDGSGNLSYDDYIEGDLGASGFDTEASFDIEVRIYDKLTATIVEQTLSVGTPVFDITKDGVSFGSRYDNSVGGPVQIKNMLPLLSKCHLYVPNENTNKQELPSGNTLILFGSGTELIDVDGLHSTSSNTGRITIDKNGLYYISSHLFMYDKTGGSIRILSVRLNGTTNLIDGRWGYDPDGRWAGTVAGVIPLSAGDYIEMYIHQNSGSSAYVRSASFNIFLVMET